MMKPSLATSPHPFRTGARWTLMGWALLTPVLGQPSPAPWTVRSNQNAEALLAVSARFTPEAAGELGMPGLDNRILDLGPALNERERAAFRASADEMDTQLLTEKDPRVRQDLEILREAAVLKVARLEADQRYLLPNLDVSAQIYAGVRALLGRKIPPTRRPSAVLRLQRYAGLAEGYTPLTVLAEAQMRAQLDTPGLLFPLRQAVEQQLVNSDLYLDEVGTLLLQYQLPDGNKPLQALRVQISAWKEFLRRDILPRAREDFRLPEELYALRLREAGVDISPGELSARALTGFVEIRNQMLALAPLVADHLQLEARDYLGVIRELRSKQLADGATLPLYQERLTAVTDIIRREKLVSLPAQEVLIRRATPAESASLPTPFLQPPPLINNQGEQGEFVLPLASSSLDGSAPQLPDFNFDAATWTLLAHEARPGHGLQFSSMVDNGVSLARALFAMNSVNMEGWALYAEAEITPYLPLDGQLIALQLRLLRAARAFLDPGLQRGGISLDEARWILVEQVGLSAANAEQELQRYTFRMPGQATSYFYGYQRLLALRASTEIALGRDFNRQRFHDFLLGEGLLPPAQLSRAVEREFIPAERAREKEPPAAPAVALPDF